MWWFPLITALFNKGCVVVLFILLFLVLQISQNINKSAYEINNKCVVCMTGEKQGNWFHVENG